MRVRIEVSPLSLFALVRPGRQFSCKRSINSGTADVENTGYGVGAITFLMKLPGMLDLRGG